MMKLFKKAFTIFSCTLLLFLSTPTFIHADIGPKPSVTITIENTDDRVYYATLLSKYESTGPESAYRGDNARYTPEDEQYEIWKAFVDYTDKDNFYFLQIYWNCTETDSFCWGYFPPDTFKVLLYFPDTNEFVVSDICERYAFDSYFNLNMDGTIQQAYDYSNETSNLVVRILLTILLEIGIAILFKIKQKDQLWYITKINVITQIGLNLALNAVNFYKGQWAFVFYYILLEILVFILEAIFYRKKLQKKAIPYAFIANVCSFVIGLWIAHIIPGIF